MSNNNNNSKIDANIIYGVVGFILISMLGLLIYSHFEQKKLKNQS